MSTSHIPELSIVVPVYNEQDNLEELHARITDACYKLGKTFEAIYVDDGSTDNSYAVLKNIQAEHETVVLIRLRKNFGQTAALSAGFDHARGGIVITLDGDLQNDPQERFNVYDNLRYKNTIADLKRRLEQLRHQYKDTTDPLQT